MYLSHSYNPLAKVFYRPIEAVLRWCNLTAHEAQILEATGRCPIMLNTVFPQWPCPQANTEKIFFTFFPERIDCFLMVFGLVGQGLIRERRIDHRADA